MMILINLVLFVCVGAVRVPTTWPQHPSTATYQYNNNNRMNGWHDDPKRRYTIVPYFPAPATGGLNESKDQYVGQRKPNNKKLVKPRRKTQAKIISQPHRTLSASIRFGKNLQPSPYRVQITNPYPRTTNIENHIVHPNPKQFNPPKEFQTNFQPIFNDNNVATRPIYPGSGVWAQAGVKHQPYIRPPSTTTTTEVSVEEDADGYDIFKAAKKDFQRDKIKYKENLNGIAKQNRLKHKEQLVDASNAYSNHRDGVTETTNHEVDDDFVPQRTYSQVRKYEDEEHLPADLAEPKLREIIKDSKVHTVYTEEGYEDSSYDHGDEEKNGENEEMVGKNSAQDSITAGSNYGDNNYAQTEILKTTAVKENSTGGMEYEISSEMKIKVNPKRKPKLAYSKKMSGNIDFAQLPNENSTKLEIDDKTAQSIMSDISAHFVESKSRKKRDTKYPYYETKTINKMSPLRFAENMENIPIKTPGKMAFYEQANQKVRCEEVPNNVNPIPEGVEDGKNNTQTKDKKPRLINLGDKIDCFKLRYFGDDPLDSPFFSEDLIENPQPIFKELGKSEETNIDKTLYQIGPHLNLNLKPISIIKPVNPTPIAFNDSDLYENKEHKELIENIGESDEVSITTSLPTNEEINTELPVEASQITENIQQSFNSKRQAKVSDLIFDLQNPTNSTDFDYDYDLSNSTSLNDTESLPDALALRMKRRRRRKHPQYPIRIKINKYVPKYNHHPVPFNQIYPTTTTSPKYNMISEVFYKDDIKPNEQLNVFADIINNIKNATRDAETSSSEHQNPIAIRLPTTKRKPAVIMKYKKPISFDQPIEYMEVQNKLPRPNRKKRLPYNDLIYEEYMNSLKQNISILEEQDSKIDDFYKITNQPIQKKKRKHAPKMEYLEDGNVGTVNPDYEPYPANTNPISTYTTIDIPINKFFVPGMKPPPAFEKPYIYSDYQLLTTNLLRRRNDYSNHRMKRSPARLAYSEIRRQPSRKKPEIEEEVAEEEEEEDDYVPHRPTNFHYDPKTDKIIYDKKPEQQTSIEYEEVEEEEEEEKVEKVTKAPNKSTLPHTVYHKDVLNKANGPTIVDFLAKLKTDPKYKIIPDPEPKESKTTTTTTIAPSNKKTTPPEFLSFLDKLHKSEGYKKIEFEEEETTKKKKPATTTTEAAVEEEEEDEEEPLSNVQNSPGGQFNSGGGFQLFDISEYLPKTKNYSPRTSIDYSKYKTIERTTSRHNLSSRYSEDEDLPLDRMGVQKPLNEAIIEEESKSEEKIATTKRPTTTTTTTTTTTKKPEIITTSKPRIRTRKRPTTTKRPSTTTSIFIEQETQQKPATHRPPTRVYPRRQKPKIRLRSTTTPSPVETLEEDSTPKIRRTQRKLSDPLIIKIPTNHKPQYTPIDRIDTNPIYLASHKQPRLVTPDIINYNNTRINNDKPDNHINPRKLDVEVFKNYDKTKQHGGNYISETDKAGSEQLSDIVVDPLDYYSDPVLPSSINKLSQEAEDRSSDYDYDDEVKIFFDGGEKKKTGIIKDPSKRLYFYAPV